MSRWKESEHPRRPRGSKGGGEWVGVAADRLGGVDRHWPHYTPGTDRVGWLGSDEGWDTVYGGRRVPDAYGNPAMAGAARQQGWHQPVATGADAELDAAVAAGGTELWRGARARAATTRAAYSEDYAAASTTMWGTEMVSVPAVSAHEMMQSLRDGKIGFGNGIYTAGIYASTDIKTGNAYAGRYGPGYESGSPGDRGYFSEDPHGGRGDDSVVRMVLRPGARTITYESPEYMRERDAFDHFYLVDQPQGTRTPSEYDLGHWLVIRGYDVVFVDSKTHNDDGAAEADQYIILNPTAVIMSQDHRGDYGDAG